MGQAQVLSHIHNSGSVCTLVYSCTSVYTYVRRTWYYDTSYSCNEREVCFRGCGWCRDEERNGPDILPALLPLDTFCHRTRRL